MTREKTYPESKRHKPNPVPFRQPYPVGVTILSELEARGLDRNEFVKKIARGAKYPNLAFDMMLDGSEQFPMIPVIAFQLELELGISADFWMALQALRDLWPFRKAHLETGEIK